MIFVNFRCSLGLIDNLERVASKGMASMQSYFALAKSRRTSIFSGSVLAFEICKCCEWEVTDPVQREHFQVEAGSLYMMDFEMDCAAKGQVNSWYESVRHS